MDASKRKKLLLKRKRAILLARDSLLAFAQYINPTPDDPDDVDKSLYQVAAHHKLIAESLQKLESGEIKRLIITCPPRSGKSELASKIFPAWYAGRNPSNHMITATYNQNFANEFGRSVRSMMLHPLYKHVFPDVALKPGAKSADRLETEQRGVLKYLGRGGSATGRGAHCLIIDDPIKDRVEANSPTTLETCWTWYTQVLSTRLMTDDSRILAIMTRWAEGDLIGRLTDPRSPHYVKEEADKWTIIDLPAIAGEDDILGRKPGEPLWPERFSKAYLEEIQRQDPRGFASLYQGRPAPEEGAFFTKADIVEYQSIDEIPKDVRYYVASDHAVSTLQTADLTCILPVAVDNDGVIWVLPDTIWRRMDANSQVEAMLAVMRKYRPIFWWAERGAITRSIGPFLRKRMQEEKTYCSIDDIIPVADKVTRAQSIKGRMSMQMVKFPAFASWWSDARHQILTFPQASHDDFVDSLSMVGLGLAKQTTAIGAPTQKARKIKVGSLAWVKAASEEQKRIRQIGGASEGW